MDIAIIGAHGQVGRQLTRALVDRGDDVRAVIRKEDQIADVEGDGATAVLHDLEADDEANLAAGLKGADAVVFAAGAGPGSGAERKWTVDFEGARHTIRAAEQADVGRYVMLSAMGTDNPPTDDEVFSVYLRAKMAADLALQASGTEWTILRPGALTDDDPTGRVRLARHVAQDDIPRADVVATIAAILHEPATGGHVLEVVRGDDAVEEAVRAATTSS